MASDITREWNVPNIIAAFYIYFVNIYRLFFSVRKCTEQSYRYGVLLYHF